jgi:hypothetical protein
MNVEKYIQHDLHTWMNFPGLLGAWRCWACALRRQLLCFKIVLINQCFITCCDLMKGTVDLCDIIGCPGTHWHGSASAHQSAYDTNFVEIPCMLRQNILAWFKWEFYQANPVADFEAYVFMKFTWFAPHFHLFFSWIDILYRADWGCNLLITKFPASLTHK